MLQGPRKKIINLKEETKSWSFEIINLYTHGPVDVSKSHEAGVILEDLKMTYHQAERVEDGKINETEHMLVVGQPILSLGRLS